MVARTVKVRKLKILSRSSASTITHALYWSKHKKLAPRSNPILIDHRIF